MTPKIWTAIIKKLSEQTTAIARMSTAVVTAINRMKVEPDAIAKAVAEEVKKLEVKVDVQSPDVKVPNIPAPQVTVTVPEIKIPEIKLPTIKVPKPEVTVNVPKPDPVRVEFGDMQFPAVMDVNVRDNILRMMPVDPKGNYISPAQATGGPRHVKATLQASSETIGNATIQANDSPSIDAFGRWRVSEPQTIFDSKQLYDNQPLFWDDQEVSGGGTASSHSVNLAATTMQVSASTAGKRVRQTFMRFNYQPGKSQLILCTGVLNFSGGGTGIKQAFGYFDDKNGLFLQNNEGTIQLVKRSYTSGSAVDTEVDQSDWNLDKMDGTGTSGVTLDFSKTQILFIDFEWLGVGRVRMGFVVDGKIYYAHEFNHANNIAIVYMSTPNLPIRYEISNDGNGGAAVMTHICSTVISEGGVQKLGVLRHKDSLASITYTTAKTQYITLAGRLKSTHLGLSIDIESISSLLTSNDFGHWELRVGGTVGGSTLVWTPETNSGVEIAYGTGYETHSGGTSIDGGYIATSSSSNFDVPSAARLGSDISGTSQVFYLVFTPETNNTNFQASVTWRELL